MSGKYVRGRWTEDGKRQDDLADLRWILHWPHATGERAYAEQAIAVMARLIGAKP